MPPVMDIGEVNVSLFTENIAGVVTEALLSMQQSKDANAPVAGTSYNVPLRRQLKLHTIIIAWQGTATTANSFRLRLRVNKTGAAIVSSPTIFTCRIGLPGSLISGAVNTMIIPIPEGIIIPSGAGLGVTISAVAAGGVIDICIVGTEKGME